MSFHETAKQYQTRQSKDLDTPPIETKKLNLRREQPHLWQRVCALSVAWVFIGFPLLFAPSEKTPNANVSILAELLPLHLHAWIFMVIGICLFVGTFFHKNNYRLTRMLLVIAAGYSLMWLLSLVYGVLTGDIVGLSIVSLWSLFTYFIYNTLTDPGFTISDLIREVRKHRA